MLNTTCIGTDPTMGQYTQSDPIGLAGGSFSTYAYTGGNPMRYVDPLGLDKIKICLKQGTFTLTDDNGIPKLQASAYPGCSSTPSRVGYFKAGQWQKDKVNQTYPNTRIPYSDPSLGWLSGYGPWFLPINTNSGSYTTTGIHGTSIFGAMPWSCSHGCVRLSNSDIEDLHKLLPKPKGTPIEIDADCGEE